MKKENKLYQLIEAVLNTKTNREQELILFNEIAKVGYKVVYQTINEKFSNLPIAIEDTYSYMYLVFIDTIRWCQLHKSNARHFVNLFLYKLKYCVMNLCIKYSRHGHMALNFCDTSVFEIEQGYESEIIKNYQLWHDVQKAVTDIQRQILKYKLDGYKVCEIAKKLKCSAYYIRQQIILIQANPVVCALFNRNN